MQPYFELPIEVGKETIDANNHVNNLFYLQWMNDVATTHAAALGSDIERCLSNGGSWFAREHTMTYLAAAYLGDTLTITTWVTELTKISCMRHYKITRCSDNKIIFKGKSFWVFVNAENGKLMKIPKLIRDCFSVVEVSE